MMGRTAKTDAWTPDCYIATTPQTTRAVATNGSIMEQGTKMRRYWHSADTVAGKTLNM